MSTGILSAGDPQTAQAGAVALEAGGTAIDAVVAAAFAAFFAEGPLCSPAGGGLLLSASPGAAPQALDFFSVTPGLGSGGLRPEDFHPVTADFGPTTQVFHVGRSSIAVPGALAGLLEAHDRGGRLPLSEVLAPAIHLGRRGARLGPMMGWVFELLRPILTLTPGARALYQVGGAVASAGDTVTNRDLAALLEALGRDRPGALRLWREELLEAAGPAAGGLLTREDLDRFRPTWRTPLCVPFHGHRVYTPPPPASGGALVSLALALAERLALWERGPVALALGTAEVLREVSLARAAQGALDSERARGLLDPRDLADRAERLESQLGGTTHISVLDRWGGAASLTMSNGEGSGHVVAGLGVHLNNFLGEEDLHPAGFHRGVPGAPLTTMMTPTLALRDGVPVLALGSGGSNRIRSVVFQVLLRHLGAGSPLEEAVLAPRLHVEGESLALEAEGLPPAALAALTARWSQHSVFSERSLYFGGVHAVCSAGGVGDPRRDGACLVIPSRDPKEL
ncbi:MAG: gamma-glutamyltransferase [Deltaproteobacteria bacterium]|nr:gamma-glutamyltransferase [Deltaproteobacteria bacterium]